MNRNQEVLNFMAEKGWGTNYEGILSEFAIFCENHEEFFWAVCGGLAIKNAYGCPLQREGQHDLDVMIYLPIKIEQEFRKYFPYTGEWVKELVRGTKTLSVIHWATPAGQVDIWLRHRNHHEFLGVECKKFMNGEWPVLSWKDLYNHKKIWSATGGINPKKHLKDLIMMQSFARLHHLYCDANTFPSILGN